MAKFVFIYHGGSMPETQEEGAEVMAAWEAWAGGMGEAVVDFGNPVGKSSTVHSGGKVTEDGGANPTSGYSLVRADSKEQAVEMAKGCPILLRGGSVEVAEAMEM